MEYSNDIKIHELEPLYYSASNRAEFRLSPDKIYTNSLRLLNVGVTKPSNQDNLNKLAGVAGCISSISILDGNVEIQSLTRANEWAAIKHSFKSNSYNEDLGSVLNLTRKSAHFNLADRTNAQGGAGANIKIVGSKVVEGTLRAGISATNTTERRTAKGQLDLSDYMGFLQSVNYLDTSLMKDLKVVIEYNMDALAIMFGNQSTGGLATTRPLLVVEEIVDPSIVSANMGKTQVINYKVIENDIVSVEAMLPTAAIPNPVQPKTYHIHAYNNKSVDRMLIKTRTTLASTENTGNTNVMYGMYNSQAMLKQKNQVRVNGMNIYARDGISKENERLAGVADIWSPNMSIMPFQQGLAFRSADTDTRDNVINMGNEAIGTQSYFACDLAGEKVKDLQIDYERVGFFNADAGQLALCKYNSAVDLILFAEVKKAVIFSGGSYNVVYV
tara:strand:+ start:2605 stop:3933 length:1329 start_codon:yes stop_codon:yes gene_type:complete